MDEFSKATKNFHRQIKDWSSKLRSLACTAYTYVDNVKSLVENCVLKVFRLRNLVIDQAEVSVRVMEQNFSIPHGSIEYAQKDDTAWTNVKRKKKKFDKAEANTRRLPTVGDLPSNTRTRWKSLGHHPLFLGIVPQTRLGDRGLKRMQYWLRLTVVSKTSSGINKDSDTRN